MSLDSEYNKMKEFTNLLTNFKNLKPKNSKQYVDELCEKYYNAYKNNYDGDELREAKKKKIDYKQFELFDKTDKKLTLDEETKHFIKEIKNREKNVDKKGFTKYF